MPYVTAHDEPWPFFLHHFWPKLAPSILNFYGKKRSFQWCPDQSDRSNGALNMHKNAQKGEWKNQSKISCHYTWLLHAKICLSWWRFLRRFLTTSTRFRRSITTPKRKVKEKKGRQKKFQKFEKPKDLGHFLLQKLSQNFDFCACPSHNVVKRNAGGKKGKLFCCKRIFVQIKANLAKIQLKKHQSVQKMHFFAKSSRSQWVKE